MSSIGSSVVSISAKLRPSPVSHGGARVLEFPLQGRGRWIERSRPYYRFFASPLAFFAFGWVMFLCLLLLLAVS